MELSVELAPRNRYGLSLKNPVMTASGTFGYGTEYARLMDIQKLGAIISKGTTLKPRDGNPQPRITETPSGVLNAIGLQNIGVEALVRDKAPIWAGWQVPVIVNIAGACVEEYGEVAAALEGVAGIGGIEVNISCPNVSAGGAEFGIRADSAAKVTAAVRRATSLPVIVKLTSNTAEVSEIAQAVVEAGADAISLINTLKGMVIDIKRGAPVLGNVSGGLSGPAIKPVALYHVYQVSQLVSVPVIGVGGIMTAEDVIEFIMAGATAVQVGTATFPTPAACLKIIDGIRRFMTEKEIATLAQLRGMAW